MWLAIDRFAWSLIPSAKRVGVAAMGLVIYGLCLSGCGTVKTGEVDGRAGGAASVDPAPLPGLDGAPVVQVPTPLQTDAASAEGDILGGIGVGRWSKSPPDVQRKIEAATRGTNIRAERAEETRRRINMPADAAFDPESVALRPSLLRVLDELVDSLRKNPRQTILIIGHTDRSEAGAMHGPVSLARAGSVRDYLAMRGVNPTFIAVQGRGATQPLPSNGKDHGRARNRRVEIYVGERGR